MTVEGDKRYSVSGEPEYNDGEHKLCDLETPKRFGELEKVVVGHCRCRRYSYQRSGSKFVRAMCGLGWGGKVSVWSSCVAAPQLLYVLGNDG
nr:hypothetical protein CFP56_57056 [Quercus suber]